MATLSEIRETVQTIEEAGCKDYVLLKCTSTYPSPPENSNLFTIPNMREIFSCDIGLSDHTLGIGASIAAVSQGASVIEKHLTLSRSDGGVDSSFSMEPNEMKQLVVEVNRAWKALGSVFYGPTEAEKESLIFRRSLYAAEDIRKKCNNAPSSLYRFVYNGVYNEQVRTYDISRVGKERYEIKINVSEETDVSSITFHFDLDILL